MSRVIIGAQANEYYVKFAHMPAVPREGELIEFPGLILDVINVRYRMVVGGKWIEVVCQTNPSDPSEDLLRENGFQEYDPSLLK